MDDAGAVGLALFSETFGFESVAHNHPRCVMRTQMVRHDDVGRIREVQLLGILRTKCAKQQPIAC